LVPHLRLWVRNSSPKSFELEVVEARKHEINQACDHVAYSSMQVHSDKLPNTFGNNLTEHVLSSLFKNMNFDHRNTGRNIENGGTSSAYSHIPYQQQESSLLNRNSPYMSERANLETSRSRGRTFDGRIVCYFCGKV